MSELKSPLEVGLGTDRSRFSILKGMIGWIVTYLIHERGGGLSSGYVSSGFFGGKLQQKHNHRTGTQNYEQV